LYFAAAEDLRGQAREVAELPSSCRTIADFTAWVETQYPAFAGHMGHIRIARNEAFAGLEDLIEAGDTLALIPPVAGG
jgi:sulfur-carrier protein